MKINSKAKMLNTNTLFPCRVPQHGGVFLQRKI